MYSKILAPLDGSKLSECTLDHIKAVATGCQVSEVILLTVLKPATFPYPSEIMTPQTVNAIEKMLETSEKESWQTAKGYLDRVAGDLKKQGIAVQSVLLGPQKITDIAEAILDYIRSNKIDLVIMSTHGRSGISRWAFGSVADKLIRHANIPVLTVVPNGCRI